jgi:hypothetical protein
VKRPGPLFNKRATFVIDTDRRVLATFHSEMNMNLHADKAIEVLRGRQAAPPEVELVGEPQAAAEDQGVAAPPLT